MIDRRHFIKVTAVGLASLCFGFKTGKKQGLTTKDIQCVIDKANKIKPYEDYIVIDQRRSAVKVRKGLFAENKSVARVWAERWQREIERKIFNEHRT